MLTIAVIGPVEVRRDDGAVRVPAGKTAELLVRLALQAGEPVSSDRLIEDLWSIDGTPTRRNTLQSKVVKLRRALGDPAMVESRDGGYRLVVDRAHVDALAAIDDAAAARDAHAAGDDHRAVELCASTLACLTSDPLVGAGDGAWAAPYRARLDATRRQLIETWCSARLRLGAASDVIGHLEAAVADYPFEEPLWVLLITALYQSGRQADALAAYKRVRTTLADDLGLDPGPQLRQLEQQILVHDAALVGHGHIGHNDHAGNADRVDNLPPLAIGLLGRRADTATVLDLIATHRLVEIIGPGGVGKTALAIAVGRVAPEVGSVWLVRLESATNTSEVTDATLAALGVTGGEAALAMRLKAAPALVILDNCEHLLDVAAAWTGHLLAVSPDVQILCTSQAPLGIAGSAVFELAPLTLDDAVELFTERATAQHNRPRRHDEREADAVRALCTVLDGLPLAIELAAARTRTLSLAEITRRLDDRFTVLHDATSRQPERRRALRATIGWSYDLLFPDDQKGLWALATFTGGAVLAAVECVLAALGVPAPAAVDVVDRLATRSLLLVDHDETNGELRYRLLESIKAYALDKMTEAGQADLAFEAHARWFAHAAAASTEGVRSSRQAEHLAFARSERPNIDAALTWCAAHQPMTAVRIANGFGWAWVVLGDSRGAQRLRSALDAAGDAVAVADRVEALLLIGWIKASTGHIEPARHDVLEATALAESIGDVELRARCSYYLAYVVSHHGDFREGQALTDRARALLDTMDRPWDQAANGLFAARAAISAGDQPRSVDAAANVGHWLRLVDDPWLRVRGDGMLGELARLLLRFDDAVTHIARAAETSRRLGFKQTEAYQVASLGRAQCQAGDYESGATTLQRSIDSAETIGDLRMAALARVHLGRVLRALGRTNEARTVLEQTTAWHRAAGGGEQALLGECLLAALDAADEAPDAEQHLKVIVDAARHHDDAPVEVFALDALARIAAERGDSDDAPTALLDHADRRMTGASHFIAERDRVDAHAVRGGPRN